MEFPAMKAALAEHGVALHDDLESLELGPVAWDSEGHGHVSIGRAGTWVVKRCWVEAARRRQSAVFETPEPRFCSELDVFRQEVALTARAAALGLAAVKGVASDERSVDLVVGDCGVALREGPPGPGDLPLRVLAQQLLDALATAHEGGLSHGDVKLQNVAVRGGRARLLDWGCAAGLRVFAAQGTTAYMAPEALGLLSAGVDAARKDVWAAGVTLYVRATGVWPWPWQDGQLRLLKEIKSGPPSMEAVPAEIRDCVADMLVVDPAQRPSARDLLNKYFKE